MEDTNFSDNLKEKREKIYNFAAVIEDRKDNSYIKRLAT